jgi:SAM-dependent methyltransferase
MGYVFDFRDGWAWEKVLEHPGQQRRVERETRLLTEMLGPRAGQSLLEIGCGAGTTLAGLAGMGLQLAGVDASTHMLDIARQRTGPRVEYHRGWAEDLPFEDNAFTYAVFSGTLEFVDDPQRAVAEAGRVAKDKVFFGVVNKFALRAVKLRLRGVVTPSIYNRARFFSVWEIKQMVYRTAGNVPLRWKTIGHWPRGGTYGGRIDRALQFCRYPFGGYAAAVATLTPRFRTRPLELELPVSGKRPSGAVTG